MTTLSGSNPVVVDSSGWIEYLGEGPKAVSYAPYVQATTNLILPAIVVYEVHRKLLREKGKLVADRFQSHAFSFGERLAPLTLELAISASNLSVTHGMPMADAIIYATAWKYRAQLITSDSHFTNLDGVTFI